MVKEAEGKLKPFHVLTMSATSNGEGSITLSEADLANTTINAKLTAHKALQLRDVAKPVPFIIKQALDNPPDRTIVFVNSPRVAAEIAAEIQKHCSKVAALTGTIRGKERDDLVDNPIFQTFTKAEKPVEPHCLVATSAGEVGIDLTCSRMITDMSSAASMVQRFGRANRFAEVDAVEIFVVFNSKDKKLKAYLWGDNDLDFIKSLDGDASCLNLYNKREELAALAKKVSVVPALEPNILNILSMTSLKHDIDISDYLRGKDLQSRYVEIAWRKEVDLLGKMSQADFDRYMQQMPLRSFERLSESAKRAAEVLTEALSKEDTQIVVVTPEADKLYAPLSEVIEMKLRDCTLILPENVGGLAGGMFAVENTDNAVLDIAEIEHKHHEPRVRIVCGAEENGEVTRTQKKIEFRVGDQKLVVIKEVQKKKYSRELLSDHNDAVSATAKLFAEKAGLFAELVAALEEAGRLHDTGKANPIWQVAAIGKLKTAAVAKGNGRFNAAALNGFRHEFESLELAEGMDELVKHVVAVHHAGARPTWIGERDLAPINTNPEAMREQIRRFAQLQQQWGWWGLAYLETILRSADGYVSEE